MPWVLTALLWFLDDVQAVLPPGRLPQESATEGEAARGGQVAQAAL